MNSRERREREKTVIENKIFDVAVAIILAEGIEKLSIRKISGKIGYAPATIYNYYENKEEILNHISYTVYLEVVEEVKKTVEVSSHLQPNELIRMCSLIFIYTMMKYPEKFKAIMMTSPKIEDEKMEEDNQGIGILQQLILTGKEQGMFSAANEHSAELHLIALMGFVFHCVSNNMVLDKAGKQMAEAYVDMLIRGLG
ncbi:TetR/AcrR family transcriptional regulator [Enterococcus sp. BWB1-3]|uniref:TetR/AcrR family transcriptional regulator n=1 Tax=Enterococcus sp. BWB1-3 TaxID=2787713 RepID=UPI00192293C4|nr:TetR/AcrR family transcriptional regulator [Enterococcus sp. BWB1-3]MBL1230873.1 TetR/AcrR family transcriptional regulator [Enterococcus sp. BWB1-3]